MKVGIVRFPGSNCDADMYRAVTEGLGEAATFLWHKSHDLEGSDVVVLPGGFSYGDYLRAGAIARFSPIMREVIDFARAGGLTLGICNGFQVLCEAHLLPGALVRNAGLRFRCHDVGLRVENADTAFTSAYDEGRIIHIPVAHGEGQFVAEETTLDELEAENRVVFRYADDSGEATARANPNGSARNIAGIINARGNVMGMMPHPERHALAVLGNTDGLGVFESLLSAVARGTTPVGLAGEGHADSTTSDEADGGSGANPEVKMSGNGNSAETVGVGVAS